MSDLLIIGAGGHGRVVLETAELEGKWDNIKFLDDKTDVDMVLDHKIIGKMDDYKRFSGKYEYAIVCIGDNEKRLKLIKDILKVGYKVPVIIHHKAFVSEYSEVGNGSVILAGVVINTGAKVGMGCIININSSVDHDCVVGDGTHVCSGAVVRSMCRIGRLSYVGAGAVVKSGTVLKDKYILADGEVV
ncbi:NeuD/PglB/VioB family sugar acetyltransferase [Clostridium estertheticum]|uniref:NeuD/PglB/VioB family sugar acetyltransferase n=1 Tax=Clostridium estertheticum TaxID=238834 RepID=UPI00124CA62A|nr:NeuD/PglB/VioB family sugar acetyltransferase [Clostridium estertheticum]MBZ9616145.1 NeuD/PglB/VioB family sugar acetyltransferase [Clostridium estertheticum subsp. laramiense]WAG71894.1 NeuD/PglB/VioB family sugar acetyltransferase [Clostridium estertheticum]